MARSSSSLSGWQTTICNPRSSPEAPTCSCRRVARNSKASRRYVVSGQAGGSCAAFRSDRCAVGRRILWETEISLPSHRHPAHVFEYERYFSPAGVWPKEIVRIEFTSAIIELVAEGFGASILPAWSVPPDVALRGVTLCDLAPEPVHVTWHVFGRSKLMEGNVSILNTVASAIRSTAQSSEIGE